MLSHFNGTAQAKAADKGVPELLAELAEIRTKKAELTRREGEIVAAARARLQKEQQALEGLKKKVSECGIEFNEDSRIPHETTVKSSELQTASATR